MDKKTDIPDRILHLITREVTGRISKDEETELTFWLQDNQSFTEEFDNFKSFIKKAKWNHLAEKRHSEQRLNHLRSSLLSKVNGKKKFRRWLSYAAIILILLGIPLVYYFLENDDVTQVQFSDSVEIPERNQNALLILSNGDIKVLNDPSTIVIKDAEDDITNKPGELLTYENLEEIAEPKSNTLIVPAGSRYQLILSDGTRVWMNSVSELTYPLVFSEEKRIVKLKGEAFFDVAENSDKPFIVESENQKVAVLGTSFNISSYHDDNAIETTLVTGKISLTTDNGEQYFILPDQQARLSKNSQNVEILNVETQHYTSWKDGILHFNKMELTELAKRLERWYDVTIIIDNKEKAKLTFSGAVENSRKVDFILDLLCKTTDINYELNGKEIIIK